MTNELNESQLRRVNQIFDIINYRDWSKYKGRYVSYLELMKMHRAKFGVMANLNDLLCKGSMDY